MKHSKTLMVLIVFCLMGLITWQINCTKEADETKAPVDGTSDGTSTDQGGTTGDTGGGDASDEAGADDQASDDTAKDHAVTDAQFQEFLKSYIPVVRTFVEQEAANLSTQTLKSLDATTLTTPIASSRRAIRTEIAKRYADLFAGQIKDLYADRQMLAAALAPTSFWWQRKLSPQARAELDALKQEVPLGAKDKERIELAFDIVSAMSVGVVSVLRNIDLDATKLALVENISLGKNLDELVVMNIQTPTPMAILSEDQLPRVIAVPDDFTISGKITERDDLVSIVEQYNFNHEFQNLIYPDFIVKLDLPDDHPNGPYPFLLCEKIGELPNYDDPDYDPLMSPFLSQSCQIKESHPVWIDREKLRAYLINNDENYNAQNLPNTDALVGLTINMTLNAKGWINNHQLGNATHDVEAFTIQDVPTFGEDPDWSAPVIEFPVLPADEASPTKDASPGPDKMKALPALCPRLVWDAANGIYYNDGFLDPTQSPPKFQIQQPDHDDTNHYPFQQNAYQLLDECNVLTLEKVIVLNDYESIKVKEGPAGIWNDGQGGPISNIYYIVMPYRPDLASIVFEPYIDYSVPIEQQSAPGVTDMWNQMIQPFLHILQGEVFEPMGKFRTTNYYDYTHSTEFQQSYPDIYPLPEPYRPSRRLQSFMPSLTAGAEGQETFLNGATYRKCECLDTGLPVFNEDTQQIERVGQAPYQEWYFRNTVLWDWDIISPPMYSEHPDCVAVFFMEGDEELEVNVDSNGEETPGLALYGLLDLIPHETNLTDDLIAAFKVCRNETLVQPKVFYNKNHLQSVYPNDQWDVSATFMTVEGCLPY